jgi:hypothetical protein
MGQPDPSNVGSFHTERCGRQTKGTEPSKYL